MSEFDYDQLDPGIRRTVKTLRTWGFDTTDSGDGKKVGMECALPFPHVAMLSHPDELALDAEYLRGLVDACLALRGQRVQSMGEDPGAQVSIQASYDPVSKTGLLELFGFSDELLPADENMPPSLCQPVKP